MKVCGQHALFTSLYILILIHNWPNWPNWPFRCCPCPLHPFAMRGYAEAVRSALARFGNSLPFGHRRLLLPTSWQLLLRPHQTRHIIGPCSRNWHEQQVEVYSDSESACHMCSHCGSAVMQRGRDASVTRSGSDLPLTVCQKSSPRSNLSCIMKKQL